MAYFIRIQITNAINVGLIDQTKREPIVHLLCIEIIVHEDLTDNAVDACRKTIYL